jgi:hypothetical protein
MGNKLGSSSYAAGDAGGSHGDYAHGVSQGWIDKRIGGAVSKGALGGDLRKFVGRMSSRQMSANKRGNMGVEVRALGAIKKASNAAKSRAVMRNETKKWQASGGDYGSKGSHFSPKYGR